MRTLICLSSISWMILLQACGFSLSCDVQMTDKYVENSCGLINGVRFEELHVDTFYTDGQPKIYKVLCSYSANPYANGPANKVQDRIYFDQEGVTWWTDTSTNGLYRNYGNSRELLGEAKLTSATDSNTYKMIHKSQDSIAIVGPMPDLNEHDSRRQMNSSIKFKLGTWYYINFRTYYVAYLYIDENRNYKISTFNTATNW